MPEIMLCRQSPASISEADREAVRRVLFGIVDGVGEAHRKSWRRFISSLMRLEPGEIASIETHTTRSGPYHRRHFAILQTIFESQERFDEPEIMLEWIKIGAGWVIWAAGPKGGVVPLPKSISYAKADQDEFEKFHAAAMRFLRTDRAARYLWPKLKERASDEMNTLLMSFEE